MLDPKTSNLRDRIMTELDDIEPATEAERMAILEDLEFKGFSFAYHAETYEQYTNPATMQTVAVFLAE
jgi:hypothetical protein